MTLIKYKMFIEVCKSKIHRVTVTGADLQYVGSITIDEDLMNAANIIENEKVQVVDVNNGERLETYVIRGEKGKGEIILNGPAARKVSGNILLTSTPQWSKNFLSSVATNAFTKSCGIFSIVTFVLFFR